MNQARALATSLSDTQFTAIHSSDLKRAFTTAEATRDEQKSPLDVIRSPLLREQNFGAAEGKPWKAARQPRMSLEEHYAKGIFPMQRTRNDKFPEGESLYDVALRAERVIDEILFPYFFTDTHIAVASHGLFIKELLHALLKRNKDGVDHASLEQIQYGLRNTAWTRVKVVMTDQGLNVQVIAINNQDHLQSLVRQKGGISRLPYDSNQDIRNFFGGQKPREVVD